MDQDISLAHIMINDNPYNYMNINKFMRMDKNISMKAMSMCGTMLQYAPDIIKDDFKIVCAAINNDVNAIIYASNRLKNNKLILLQAINISPSIILFIFKHLNIYDTYELITHAVNLYSDIYIKLIQIDYDLMYDYELACVAVKNNGKILQYMVEEFKNDFNIIKYALLNDPYSIIYTPINIRNNIELAKYIIVNSIHHFPVELWSENIIDNKELAILYLNCYKLHINDLKLSHRKYNIKYPQDIFINLSDRLRKDISIIKLALEARLFIYQYLPECIINDEDILLHAVEYIPENIGINILYYTSQTVRDNKNLILKIIDIEKNKMRNSKKSYYSDLYVYLSGRLRKDKEIVLKCMLLMHKDMIKFIYTGLMDDLDVVYKLIDTLNTLEFVSNRIKYNKTIILDLIKFNFDTDMYKFRDDNIYAYISRELQNDKDIIRHCFKYKQNVMCLFLSQININDKDLIYYSLQHNILTLYNFASSETKSDKKFIFGLLNNLPGVKIDLLSHMTNVKLIYNEYEKMGKNTTVKQIFNKYNLPYDLYDLFILFFTY